MLTFVLVKGAKDADTCRQELMNQENTVNNAESGLRRSWEIQKMDRGRSKLRRTRNLASIENNVERVVQYIHQVHPKHVKSMRIRET